MSQFPIVWTITPRQGACCWYFHPFNSSASIARSQRGKVPVVPCGRLVVISGILAGGTLGFRNGYCCFCTFSGPYRDGACLCLCFLFLMARAHLSTQAAVVICIEHFCPHDDAFSFCLLRFCCLLFLFWFCVLWRFFVLFAFLFWLPCIVHGQTLDCVRVHLLSFDAPQCGGLACFCTIHSWQGRTCATTWRKPRRRRTEKKFCCGTQEFWPSCTAALSCCITCLSRSSQSKLELWTRINL